MTESVDYNRFKKLVPRSGDRLDRVENILIAGMPDINFCGSGKECWIEMKSPKEPVRAGTPLFGSNPRVSQDQKNWFLRQLKAGGRAFFLVVTDKRWMLLPGNIADGINEFTVQELLAQCLWSRTKPILFAQWEELRMSLLL
jgi:hypothetical protein